MRRVPGSVRWRRSALAAGVPPDRPATQQPNCGAPPCTWPKCAELACAPVPPPWPPRRYAASTCQNLLSKSTLKKFPHPLTLTLSQYAAIAFTVPLLMTVWGKRRRAFTRRHYMNGLLQLCFLKLFSSLSSFFTLLEVPVSYAHTVKAMMPLFTITLSRVILGASYSTKTYMTLMPIVLGVILTSATQLEFNPTGLATAMVSTALASMQSIYSKKASPMSLPPPPIQLRGACDPHALAARVGARRHRQCMERALPPLTARDPVRAGFGPQVMKGIDHLNILVGTSQLLLVVFAPIWFMYEGREIMFGHGLDHLSYLEVCRRRAFGVCARARAQRGAL